MTQQPLHKPHNPHLLSQMRTELVWEGKYDEYGDRREVDIAGCAMPMREAAAQRSNRSLLRPGQNPLPTVPGRRSRHSGQDHSIGREE